MAVKIAEPIRVKKRHKELFSIKLSEISTCAGLWAPFSPNGRGLVSDDTLVEMRDRMSHRGPDGGGAFQPSGRGLVSDDTLVEMRDRMSHRGPDGGGFWRSPAEDCVLGHRRLSIIDLSTTANQPMLTADGKVALVFNGEIYNHADIRAELERLGKYACKTDHSDTEVLLHAYMEWGPDCVQRFYGMFAFAIYDARDPERPALHLVRDRVGIKPMYFARTDAGEWMFASEIKALLAHPAISAAMDRRRVLALSDLHRLAGAADVVRWRLQTAGGLLGDDRSHRARRSAPVLGQHSAARRVLLDQGSVVRRGGGRARAVAARVDPAAHGLGRAVRRAAVGRRRFEPQRRADVGVDESPSDDIHDRLQELRRIQRIRSRAPAREAVPDRPPRDGNQFRGGAGLPAAACRAAGRTDRRQCLHPALLSRAARQTERHDGGPGGRGGRRELPGLLVVRALSGKGGRGL